MKRYFLQLKPLLRKAKHMASLAGRVFFISLGDIVLPRRCLCVALSEGEVSVACGFRFLLLSRMRGLKKFDLESGNPQPDELAGIVEIFTERMKSYRSEITLSIPGSWTLFQTAEFPAVVKQNLKDVVSYELDRLTPFSPGQAFYDFNILGDTDQRIKVALPTTKAQPLASILQEFSKRGLGVKRVTLNASSIATLLQGQSKLPDSLFVSADEKGFEGGLLSRNALTLTFSGQYGGRKRQEAIAAEMLPVMIKLAEEKRPFDIHLLADEVLQADLGLHLSHPLKLFRPAIQKAGDLQPVSVYAATSGMIEILRLKAGSFNLLSKGSRPALKFSAALTAVLLLAGLASGALFYLIPLQTKTEKVQEIERQIKLREPEVKKVQQLKSEAEALQKEIAAIEGFRGKRPLVINILKELTTITPKTAWMSSVRITDKDLNMGGYAADPSALLAKVGAIEPYIKAEFASPVMRDSRTNTYNFSIKMESKYAGESKKNEQTQ